MLLSDGSAQVELMSGSHIVYGNDIAMHLDCNFSFSMVVARLQTKQAISKAKHASGVEPIKLNFHKKSHEGFLKSGHIYELIS